MSTITLPNIRVSSDLTVSVRLKDNGVAIDWSTLNNVKASIYSDAQRALAGRCDVSVDAEDPTVLVCQYAANKPQYVGVCRIVVSAKYMGETKTHDKPAFNFVRWTADQDGEQITIDDPDVDVEIDVADVSSSLLDEAIRAAFTAAEEAVDAKGQVLETEAEVEAAEALRVSAEESRVEAEEGRAEAEAARVDEEAVRVSAEDARVVAENARAAAEDLREGAEDDRAAAETARETAEAARVAAEALRVTAEGSRETAEAAREAQASADHTVAAGDHTQAAADHTQAAADHTTAASDHTQAGADHTLAAADHVTAGEDHAQAQDDHEVMAGYDTRLGNVEGEVSQLEAKVDEKVDNDGVGVTIVSDDSDTFYVVDSAGYVIAKIDATGIHSPNINGMVSTINEISGNLSSLSGDVTALANLVASIFDDEVENTFSDNSDELLVVDKRGYIGLRVSNRGVEGVFLNTNTGGIKNDLRKQNNLTPVIGNYGADNAVYKLSGLPDVFRVAFDFRLNDNINVTGTDKPFVRLVGASTKDVKPIHAVPTDLLVSRNGETYTAVSQVIGFNSGFNVCGTSFVRSPSTKKPIVGDTALSLWLKGNFNEESDFPTAQEVSERASWLSSHSTAKIVFANDTFSVQGVAENDINVSIKDGNNYKGLGAFYDDLVSALGNYFVFKKRRLSASKTTADLLQFGELKLVANYWQQTNKASTSLSYNYDSFPVSVPLAIDETLHTVEIVGADGNVWVSVDGQFAKYSDTLTEIYIGGTDAESGLVTCFNLEYEKGSLGDAILDNTFGIVSSRTPRVVGVMQHLVEDKYEGEQLTQAYYGSVSRMLDICRMLENRGYSVLSLNDVCLWLSGRKKVPARSIFFLATTNPTYDNFLNNLVTREIWTGASIPLIIGSIINTDVASAGGTDAMFKQVVSARAIGVDYITHLYDHDVIPDYKNSLILQQELYKLIRLCVSCGIDTRMYSYGWTCESVNYFNMLSLNGFIGAMEGGNPSINATIPYKLGRQNIDDAMTMNTLSNILI